jgi:type I restriction enzyme M protein
VTRYVNVFEEEEPVDIAKVWQELKKLEEERKAIEEKVKGFMKELGYEQ